MNAYVTVRHMNDEDAFFVNVINYDGTYNGMGQHRYVHKRSARRAAKKLAKRKDISYRQDLEYRDFEGPASFLAGTVSG